MRRRGRCWPTRPRPDALFVANNLMTLGALRAITEAGLQVPRRRPTRRLRRRSRGPPSWSPPLTVVAQPTYEIGRRAAQLLSTASPGSARPPRRAAHRRCRCGHRRCAERERYSTEMRAIRSAFCSSKSSKLIFLSSKSRWRSSTRFSSSPAEISCPARREPAARGRLPPRCSCRSASRAWRPAWPSWRGRAGASRSSFAVQPWVLPFLLTPDLPPGMTEPPAPGCRRLQPNGCGTR